MGATSEPLDRPQNPRVGHERSDVSVFAVLAFGIGLLVSAVVVYLLVWWLFDSFATRAARSGQPLPPLAARATGEPVLRQFYDNAGSATLKSRLHFRAFSVGFGRRDQLRPAKYQWNENCVPREVQERCDNPLSHGDFPDLPYWLPDFWWKP